MRKKTTCTDGQVKEQGKTTTPSRAWKKIP